jgi:GNAT superfamily N-acetyltransferase
MKRNQKSEKSADTRAFEKIKQRIFDDSIVLQNSNTTIGYACFSKASHSINYIFVNPAFRRQGYGRKLVELCEDACGKKLVPAPPISPLGRKFFSELKNEKSKSQSNI